MFGNVGPAQSVLRVVVKVQSPEQLSGFGFGEDEALFVGGTMNVCGAPDERDPVCPIISEEPLGFSAALECGTKFIEEFGDEIIHG